MKKFLLTSLLSGTFIFNNAAATPIERETINQVALLQSLTLGYFDGTMTVEKLKTLGDIGLGTFDGLDGEMIVLDGVVYRANQNCEINVVEDKVLVPFANVTFFDKDFSLKLQNIHDQKTLENTLNEFVDEHGKNFFYMVKLTANFNEILVRSESKQQKPYPRLVKALQDTQKESSRKNISGTIVGIYCPTQMQNLNTFGWHFHFISEDKKFGGHVLALNLRQGEALIDKTLNFSMYLPDQSKFSELDLSQDLREDIGKAEHDRRL